MSCGHSGGTLALCGSLSGAIFSTSWLFSKTGLKPLSGSNYLTGFDPQSFQTGARSIAMAPARNSRGWGRQRYCFLVIYLRLVRLLADLRLRTSIVRFLVRHFLFLVTQGIDAFEDIVPLRFELNPLFEHFLEFVYPMTISTSVCLLCIKNCTYRLFASLSDEIERYSRPVFADWRVTRRGRERNAASLSS